MKDTVIYSFFLPTHVLFQNRPRLSEGSDTCIHFSSCCFQQKHLSYNHGNHVLSHEVVYNERETIIKMIFLKKGVKCLPHRLRRWTRCHKTHTWPCAWGSRAAGGRASRGASAWLSSDWGRVSHWRRRWRSGPERHKTGHQNHPTCWVQQWRKEACNRGHGFLPAAASSGQSSDSPPRCGCIGWAEPRSAAPALGLGRSKQKSKRRLV